MIIGDMKKIFIAALSIAAVSAFAGPDKTPTTIACAVMPTNKVDIKKATASHMYADYKGKRYFFCCGGCPSAFKKDPAKYAKAASIKTPKVIKPAKATS
jgi:YHS domain-containing protein